MEIDVAKQRKFDAGRAAHPDSDWSAAHGDARCEAQDELLDLYWYADLLGDEVLKVRVQLWCRDNWQLPAPNCLLYGPVTHVRPQSGTFVVYREQVARIGVIARRLTPKVAPAAKTAPGPLPRGWGRFFQRPL
jgi:hypothetical protein